MQWIILLLVVGASLVSWVIKKLQEEQERRQMREQAARRELERLRTGRDQEPGGETAAQMQRAQELQARRQQQLQELRRRQQERARIEQGNVLREDARVGTATQMRRPSGQTSTTRNTPVVWAPGSSGTTVPTRPQAPARRQPTPTRQQPVRQQPIRPQPSPQPVARTLQPRPGRAQFPTAAPAPARPLAPAPPMRPAGPAHPREAYAQHGPGPGLLSTIKPANTDEWRRAIILHEVLSRPVTEREERF